MVLILFVFVYLFYVRLFLQQRKKASNRLPKVFFSSGLGTCKLLYYFSFHKSFVTTRFTHIISTLNKFRPAKICVLHYVKCGKMITAIKVRCPRVRLDSSHVKEHKGFTGHYNLMYSHLFLYNLSTLNA